MFCRLFEIVSREMHAKLPIFTRHCYSLLELAIEYRVYGLFAWENSATNSQPSDSKNRDKDVDA